MTMVLSLPQMLNHWVLVLMSLAVFVPGPLTTAILQLDLDTVMLAL